MLQIARRARRRRRKQPPSAPPAAMEDLERDSPYFEGLVPFRIVLPDREARATDLTVRVLAGSRVRR